MKSKLLIAFIVFPLALYAQPSLNISHAPPLNSMYIYNDANVPSPPFTFSKTGTNNTWDFTGIAPVSGEDDTVFIADPSLIPGASASFPSATHARYESGEITVTMLQINASGVSFLGAMGDPAGTGTVMPLVANPPLQAMTFPYTYGSSSSGTTSFELFGTGAQIGQPLVDSVHYKSTMMGSREIIAAGTMILPAGTFPALLERSIDSSIDSAWVKSALTGNQWVIAPGFPVNTLDSAFYWYSDQSLQPYAHALYDDTGLHDVVYFKSTISGITKRDDEKFTVYPNPASGFIYIQGLEKILSAEIYNATGCLVTMVHPVDGKISIEHLPSGLYILRIKGNHQESGYSRIIKE